MLRSLSIKNYALIDDLQVRFDEGFSIITGETGAGKSVLLGGLSLVLGKRADLGSLKNKEEKCVIEAEFGIGSYGLGNFFKTSDLDFEKNTILRREILPSGKSRAFVNDTPVTLDVLSSLGDKLIDIHSQHQTLQLTDNTFQFQVLDAVSGNNEVLESYKSVLGEYVKTKKELEKLIQFQQDADKEHDYHVFLLKELEEANLRTGMQQELEETYERLNNVEEIREKLSHAQQLTGEEQIGLLTVLNELKSTVQKLATYGGQYAELFTRIQSIQIELDDIYGEIQQSQESLEADPELLDEVNGKLQVLYNLLRKHNASDVEELISIKESLREQVAVTENLDNDIKERQLKVLEYEKNLDELAENIREARKKGVPGLSSYLEEMLVSLGMPHARFDIQLKATATYKLNGKDDLYFLFSANKGGHFDELKKVASGGELSRIMLTIKSLLARYVHLPTIMFDEIDTGVSGEVSHKMGEIMAQMSKTMQVFAITHLPQVAAKGTHHYKVYKTDDSVSTTTRMKLLSEEERIQEIAEMLGGKELTSSALAHAKELLN